MQNRLQGDLVLSRFRRPWSSGLKLRYRTGSHSTSIVPVTLVVSWLSLAAAPSSAGSSVSQIKQDGTPVLVRMHSMGRSLREFLAELYSNSNCYRVRSVIRPDLTLQPESAAAPGDFPREGSYLLTTELRTGGENRQFVELRAQKAKLLVFRNGHLEIEISPVTRSEPPLVSEWMSPFQDDRRKSLACLRKRLIGSFGDFRKSYRRTHRHAGIDLRAGFGEAVFPIGAGQVLLVSHIPKDGTMVLRHKLSGGNQVFSKYVHLARIQARPGDIVSTQDELARALEASELKTTGFKYNHLHLEIRKDFADWGVASSRSTTDHELAKHCLDPMVFLRTRLSD